MTKDLRIQQHPGAARARDVLVIILKFTGLMFIVLGLRESLEHLSDNVATLLGVSQSFPEDAPLFWDQAFRAVVIYPANSYFVGVLLLIVAERLAPFMLPGRWWR